MVTVSNYSIYSAFQLFYKISALGFIFKSPGDLEALLDRFDSEDKFVFRFMAESKSVISLDAGVDLNRISGVFDRLLEAFELVEADGHI